MLQIDNSGSDSGRGGHVSRGSSRNFEMDDEGLYPDDEF